MRKMNKIGAIALAAVLACSAFVLPEVYAADSVKTGETCSLEVNCNIQVDPLDLVNIADDDKYVDLIDNSVIVNLYRVADITVTGKYTPVVDGLSDLENVNHETTASEWLKLAAEAKTLVKNVEPTATAKAMDGSVTFTDLKTGMYLIDAERLLTPEHRYEFTPYLISLPNNYYYDIAGSVAEGEEIPETADLWEYNLTDELAVGLKPAKMERYGYLKIEKDVGALNVTTPGEIFVYEITATLTENDVVYNNVVSINYKEQGGKNYVFVGPIVAGAEIRVDEVYTGGSYIQSGVNAPEILKIQAEEYFDDCDTLDDARKAAAGISEESIESELVFKFTNEHNNIPKGSTGVVNTISPDLPKGMVQEFQGQ